MDKTPKDLEGLKRIMFFAIETSMNRCSKQLDIIDYNHRILHQILCGKVVTIY
jgi:hypothetical protein